jgi:hypothetical protein
MTELNRLEGFYPSVCLGPGSQGDIDDNRSGSRLAHPLEKEYDMNILEIK